MASFGFFFFNFEKALESLCDCATAITTPEEEKESWFKRARKLLKPTITDWSLYFKQRISATLENWKKEQRLENSFRAALCLLLAGLVVLVSKRLSFPLSPLLISLLSWCKRFHISRRSYLEVPGQLQQWAI
jgi:hypothetical protein